MKNGIYFVTFSSESAEMGSGTIIIQDNKVNGGDQGYVYQGKIDDSRVIMRVTRHDIRETSIFHNLHEFDLDLTIQEFDDYLLLKGHIKKQPKYKIDIKAKFLADLV